MRRSAPTILQFQGPDRSLAAVGACQKIPIPAIYLNPLAEFSDGHCRSTSARHMRIDSFSL
ncbi:hypothetical protein EBB04_19160 [Sinorhizobium meliloti]|nr:hypothetical protein EBB04_19160 [Sinorhizobium meliloti]